MYAAVHNMCVYMYCFFFVFTAAAAVYRGPRAVSSTAAAAAVGGSVRPNFLHLFS